MLAYLAAEYEEAVGEIYGNAVGVFLADAFSFCLALLEGMLVLELGSHGGRSDIERSFSYLRRCAKLRMTRSYWLR